MVRVEPPTGEPTRWLFSQRHPGMSALSMNVNRNKRSLGVDLKNPHGVELFLELLATADILVTNMRSRALERLGMAYDTLAERFPRLVYCHAQGSARTRCSPPSTAGSGRGGVSWSRS